MKSKLQTNNTNKQTKNTIELAPHLNHHVTFCDFMLKKKKSGNLFNVNDLQK